MYLHYHSFGVGVCCVSGHLVDVSRIFPLILLCFWSLPKTVYKDGCCTRTKGQNIPDTDVAILHWWCHLEPWSLPRIDLWVPIYILNQIRVSSLRETPFTESDCFLSCNVMRSYYENTYYVTLSIFSSYPLPESEQAWCCLDDYKSATASDPTVWDLTKGVAVVSICLWG